MRVALVAYGCSPHQGSEFGVGWRWALEIAARGHRVVVYTHEAMRPAIDAAASKTQGITFRYVSCFGWPVEDKSRLVHQLQYTIWQWRVMDLIAADARSDAFDLVHFVTWGGVRMPTFGWRHEAPYIIGPIGGAEEAPLSLSAGFGLRVFVKELGRKLSNRLALLDPLLIASAAGAHTILLKTDESIRSVFWTARSKCRAVCEIGSRDELAALQLQPPWREGPVKVMFAGRMLSWKAPLLVLDVYREAAVRGLPLEMLLIGDGPEGERVDAGISALGPGARVRRLAHVPQDEFFRLLQKQTIVLFPSLHDSSGNVVLEALACGVPVIALDLGGPRVLLSQGGGALISVEGRTRHDVARAIVDKIADLVSDPERYRALQKAAKASAANRTWSAAVALAYAPLEAGLSQQPSRPPAGVFGDAA